MKNKFKNIILTIIIIIILIIIIYLYPISYRFIKEIKTHAYNYGYNPPAYLQIEDTSKLPEAKAVPILMYHGIINNKSKLGENTERQNFISQMEMLKHNGYKSIFVNEFNLWRENKFILPKKPIIITFDDGRKDSFYTTDEILKALDFKATIFIATDSTENDPFFLNWEELKNIKRTGRFEIDAHGRNSHKKILIDEKGDIGNYLSSRIYNLTTGLESIENYEKRIEEDYINSKNDLLKNLNIDSNYFAIPLNSYGSGSLDLSNYDGSYKLNSRLTHKYYKLSFVQAEATDNKVLESFYNYKDSDPYKLKRLEVKNMNATDLLFNLKKYEPKPFNNLSFISKINNDYLDKNVKLLYGKIINNNGLTLISNNKDQSTRIILGDSGWNNYSIKTKLSREKGRSVSIYIYYIDENNYIDLTWGEKSIKLTEVINDQKKELDSYYPFTKNGKILASLKVENGNVNATFDKITLKSKSKIGLNRGAIGFGVWDPKEAKSTISELEIVELAKKLVYN